MLWHEATRSILRCIVRKQNGALTLYFMLFFFLVFFQKSSKGRAPISRDSKIHFKLRGRVVQGLGPIEALTQERGEQRFLYNFAYGGVSSLVLRGQKLF